MDVHPRVRAAMTAISDFGIPTSLPGLDGESITWGASDISRAMESTEAADTPTAAAVAVCAEADWAGTDPADVCSSADWLVDMQDDAADDSDLDFWQGWAGSHLGGVCCGLGAHSSPARHTSPPGPADDVPCPESGPVGDVVPPVTDVEDELVDRAQAHSGPEPPLVGDVSPLGDAGQEVVMAVCRSSESGSAEHEPSLGCSLLSSMTQVGTGSEPPPVGDVSPLGDTPLGDSGLVSWDPGIPGAGDHPPQGGWGGSGCAVVGAACVLAEQGDPASSGTVHHSEETSLLHSPLSTGSAPGDGEVSSPYSPMDCCGPGSLAEAVALSVSSGGFSDPRFTEMYWTVSGAAGTDTWFPCLGLGNQRLGHERLFGTDPGGALSLPWDRRMFDDPRFTEMYWADSCTIGLIWLSDAVEHCAGPASTVSPGTGERGLGVCGCRPRERERTDAVFYHLPLD